MLGFHDTLTILAEEEAKKHTENEAISVTAGINGPLILSQNNVYQKEKAIMGIGLPTKVPAT